MGVAAEHRASRLIRRDAREQIARGERASDTCTATRTSALELGLILSWRCGDGAVLTAGPDRTAVPHPAGTRYALYRYGGRWACELAGHSARSVALSILAHVGRTQPNKITS